MEYRQKVKYAAPTIAMYAYKNIIGIAVAAVCVTVTGIGVWMFSTPQPPPHQTTIGAILPLTGKLARVGQDVGAALEIAQEDFRGKALPVRIVYEDDGFVPTQSVNAFMKLADIDGVKFVIGPLNGSGIEAVRPLATEKRVISFTPWGAGSRIGDFTLKNSVEADAEARVIARKMVTDLGLKRLAIFYLQNDWGQVHRNAFTHEVERLGGTIVLADPLEFDETDFRSILTKARRMQPDGLYIVHNGALVGMITRQVKEMGLSVPLFGQYATESSDVIDMGGESLEGLIYTFPIDEHHLTEAQKRFIAAFERKRGGKPQVAAYNAYDIYAIYVAALAHCTPSDAVCLRDYILSLRTYAGIGGTFSFSNGRLERQFFFKTIRNGTFVPM